VSCVLAEGPRRDPRRPNFEFRAHPPRFQQLRDEARRLAARAIVRLVERGDAAGLRPPTSPTPSARQEAVDLLNRGLARRASRAALDAAALDAVADILAALGALLADAPPALALRAGTGGGIEAVVGAMDLAADRGRGDRGRGSVRFRGGYPTRSHGSRNFAGTVHCSGLALRVHGNGAAVLDALLRAESSGVADDRAPTGGDGAQDAEALAPRVLAPRVLQAGGVRALLRAAAAGRAGGGGPDGPPARASLLLSPSGGRPGMEGCSADARRHAECNALEALEALARALPRASAEAIEGCGFEAAHGLGPFLFLCSSLTLLVSLFAASFCLFAFERDKPFWNVSQISPSCSDKATKGAGSPDLCIHARTPHARTHVHVLWPCNMRLLLCANERRNFAAAQVRGLGASRLARGNSFGRNP
jgi:hypothetical protein